MAIDTSSAHSSVSTRQESSSLPEGKKKAAAVEAEEQKSYKAGICTQLMLVSTLSGVEASIAFQQVYMIMFLQYLGVPTALLSVSGTACGVFGLTIIPFSAYLTDRGENKRVRKMMAVIAGTTVYILGYLLLIVSGLLKIKELSETQSKINTSETFVHTTESFATSWSENLTKTNLESLVTRSTRNPDNISESMHALPSVYYSQLSATVFLSMGGFALLDVGFDTSMSMSRVYVVECVPKFQHTDVLVMASLCQAMMGASFSFLGVWDIPGVLGPIFGIDGTASALFFLCGVQMCLIITGCLMSVIAGTISGRRLDVANAQENEDERNLRKTPEEAFNSKKNKFYKKRKDLISSSSKLRYTADILHTEESGKTARPLFPGNSFNAKYYSATAGSIASSLPSLVQSQELTFSGNQSEAGSFDADDSYDENDEQTPLIKKKQEGEPDNPLQSQANRSVLWDAIKSSFSMSMSVGMFEPSTVFAEHTQSQKDAPVHQDTKKDNEYIDKDKVLKVRLNENNSEDEDKQKKKRKLAMWKTIILCISTFFAFGCSISFVFYVPNALITRIFHGDPTAAAGTEGRDLYEEGQRTAAKGCVLSYITYTLLGVCNKKIIDTIGEHAQYVVIHVAFIAALVSLLWTQLVEIYFVSMAISGLYRTCPYTTPFILANKQGQENAEIGKANPSSANRKTPLPNAAKLMAVIGFLVPLHYSTMSAFIGPAMDATQSVWMPIFYSLGCCVVSVLCFSILFLLPKK